MNGQKYEDYARTVNDRVRKARWARENRAKGKDVVPDTIENKKELVRQHKANANASLERAKQEQADINAARTRAKEDGIL